MKKKLIFVGLSNNGPTVAVFEKKTKLTPKKCCGQDPEFKKNLSFGRDMRFSLLCTRCNRYCIDSTKLDVIRKWNE